MASSETNYDKELGSETGKAFKALLESTLRINEIWQEFSAAWFCNNADIETMNSTSKFFFHNYRNGLLSQLVLDLNNITADKQVKGAEQASLGNLVASTDALKNWEAGRLKRIKVGMKKVSKLRNNQIAHWQKDLKTGACRKAQVDFASLKIAVEEVTDFMRCVHEKLLPNTCCHPTFERMSRPQRQGFSSIIELVRLGEDSRKKTALTAKLM